MNMKAFFLMILVMGFYLKACMQPDESTNTSSETDLSAITEAGQRLITALKEDDIPGILGELSEDHITLAPNDLALADEQGLRSWHQSRIDSFTFDINYTSEDIRIEGDMAVERWSSTPKLSPRNGGPAIEGQSKGLWVWHRQPDGSWKLLWSIWNSDNAIESNQ
jgi:ketosteroid isomerase-like protein